MQNAYRSTLLLLALALCFGAPQAAASGELRSLGKCLDVFGNTDLDGTKVVLWECQGQANQQWSIEGDGVLKKVVGLGGKCLVPGGAGAGGNTEMVIGPCDDSGQDLWTISGSFSQAFSLVHDATGLCLDVYRSMTANETPVLLFECHGGPNQTWSFSGPVPLSGLLLPYYVVDRDFSFAPTTLFAVRNGSDQPVVVRYAYYSTVQSLGNPVLTETYVLHAKRVRTVNLRGIQGLPTDPITNMATGYAVFTILDPDTRQPVDDQHLSGDYFRLDAFNNFASGDVLLDTSNGAQSLCNRWDLRFFDGGSFTGGTNFTVFVENNPGGTEPILVGRAYSEAGAFLQKVAITTPENAFEFSSFGLGLTMPFGAIEWRFADGVRGHVSGTYRASGRYSVGLPAICKD